MSDVANGENITEVTTDITDADETNAQRFKRIATKRLIKVLEAIDVLANCSAKTSYEYTPEQVDKMEKLLTERVSETIALFRGKTKVTQTDDLL